VICSAYVNPIAANISSLDLNLKSAAPRGVYEYSYLMRASVPGEFNVIPATAYEMYFPEVFGRSDGGKFVVVRE
jgi:uncharacterized protein YfaS (alpha-2-macroglobulin family)